MSLMLPSWIYILLIPFPAPYKKNIPSLCISADRDFCKSSPGFACSSWSLMRAEAVEDKWLNFEFCCQGSDKLLLKGRIINVMNDSRTSPGCKPDREITRRSTETELLCLSILNSVWVILIFALNLYKCQSPHGNTRCCTPEGSYHLFHLSIFLRTGYITLSFHSQRLVHK